MHKHYTQYDEKREHTIDVVLGKKARDDCPSQVASRRVKIPSLPRRHIHTTPTIPHEA